MPRRNGGKALELYLPKMKHYSTFSIENFKESVLIAGGKVNTTVTFLKDGIAASSYNGSAKDGKAKKAVLIPKIIIKDDVIKNINKRKYGLMLKYFIRYICLRVYILYLLMLIFFSVQLST